MKKVAKKTKKPCAKDNATVAEQSVSSSSPTVKETPWHERGIIEQIGPNEVTIRPFPNDLLDEAEAEPDHRTLAEYHAVIAKLRGKGFSFREIAEWLSKRNVDADHNAVYRVYTKYMSMDEAELEADLEQEAKERAIEES
jgi:hypothetical protein